MNSARYSIKARPILFSSPMIRALLEGRKTQTRRIVKNPCFGVEKNDPWPLLCGNEHGHWYARPCPHGKMGDLLWVRETLELHNVFDVETGEIGLCASYKAGYTGKAFMWYGKSDTTSIPSIHMPRTASRLTLEITNVHVERLQDISDADALAEGVDRANKSIGSYATERFKNLWQSLNGAASWDANPLVWVIEFSVHKQNVDDMLKREGIV